MEQTQIDALKKYGLFSVIGVILILALLGAFIPSAREYIGTLAKTVLAVVPGFIN